MPDMNKVIPYGMYATAVIFSSRFVHQRSLYLTLIVTLHEGSGSFVNC